MKNLTFFSLLLFCSLSFTCFAQTAVIDFELDLETVEPTQDWNLESLALHQIIELEDIAFAADQTVLSEESMESLSAFSKFLTENPQVKVEVRGHTNSIPADTYCDALSLDRAKVVANYLISSGVQEHQLTATGYGKRVPRNSGQTERERKSNQRVDVKILSLK